jgi:fructosamine-3-kinase
MQNRRAVTPPDSVLQSVEQAVGCSVRSITPVGGGCIANAARVATDNGPYFLKWATGSAGETFVAEGTGLRALAAVESSLVVPVPIIMMNATSGEPGVLLIDWIDVGSKTLGFWERLGTGLAQLHRETSGERYGFEHDNFIGRLPQRNEPCLSWPEFFLSRRIIPQVEMARERNRWSGSWDRGLSGLQNALPSILPLQPHPSIVHGDLWAGNVLATSDGRAAVVDPAVYRGDREVDLAMSELFGGFSPSFYDAYNASWQIDRGYEGRRDVYNLYHLINHLNHFGSGYAGQVAGILRRFG